MKKKPENEFLTLTWTGKNMPKKADEKNLFVGRNGQGKKFNKKYINKI